MRDRPSVIHSPAMKRRISVAEAQSIILETAPRLGSELVSLREAQGRVLAEPIASGRTLPPADNSAMDGYALRAADLEGARKIIMDVERDLGYEPIDRETEKLGYDIESKIPESM